MPILRSPDENQPISQGDILKGLRLYATGSNWDDTDVEGGSPEWLEKVNLSLVVSRPCVTLHKPQFVVAAIHAIREPVPDDLDSFDKVRSFLSQIRDGSRQPDRFYLGQIQDHPKGRYYAHLDSLHTIARPDGDDADDVIRRHRIATLSDDFRHDLHLRLFSAYATLGFGDFEWFPDDDLKWLIEAGRAELGQRRAECGAKQAELASLNASGSAKNEKHTQSLQHQVQNLQSAVQNLESELSKYEEELKRREANAPSVAVRT